MKELWELAISPGVLPFSLLLIPIALYWVFCLLGFLDLDFLDFDLDFDADVDVDVDGAGEGNHGGGVFSGMVQGALRFMNATDVPLMAVLSFLFIFLWGLAMAGNHLFNPDSGEFVASMIGLGSLVGAVFLTKWLTAPMKPFFRTLKGTEGESKPVVGRTGTVRSRVIDEHSGQVEVEDPEAPLLVNARLSPGSDALARGAKVLVYQHDAERGIYLVRSLEDSTP